MQGLPSSQTANPAGAHAPDLQASPLVHALPSEQATIPATGATVQPDLGSQAFAVQGLPSSQTAALPDAHAPDLHASPTVQALSSEHAAATET